MSGFFGSGLRCKKKRNRLLRSSRKDEVLCSDFPQVMRRLFATMTLVYCSLPTGGEEDTWDLYAIASETIGVNSRFVAGNRYPSVLYRVRDGSLLQVRTITTASQGSLFTRVFHDKGYVLVGSKAARPGSILLDVLDMRSLARERSYDLDACSVCVYYSAHLLNRTEGLVFLVHTIASFANPSLSWSYGGVSSLSKERNSGFFLRFRPPRAVLNDAESSFLGVDLAREQVVTNLDFGALRDAYSYGASGGLVDGEDYVYPVLDGNGEALAYHANEFHPLGWQLPEPLRPSAQDGESSQDSRGEENPEQLFPPFVTVQIAHNDHLRVVADAGWDTGSTSARAFHVFDKASQTWARIALRGDLFQMRTYGPWLAHEEHYYRENRRDWQRQPEYRSLFAQRAPFSLYAKAQNEHFSSTAERLIQARVVPAGWLHLYHVNRQKHVAHHTGEINSEALYVDEEDRVYYRVNDELRRASVVDGRLKDIVVLARHPVILAVHHLFLGKH